MLVFRKPGSVPFIQTQRAFRAGRDPVPGAVFVLFGHHAGLQHRIALVVERKRLSCNGVAQRVTRAL